MPELPDLQVFSENLNKKIAGKKLLKANIKAKLSIPASKIKKAVEGQKLLRVQREGKELWFYWK